MKKILFSLFTIGVMSLGNSQVVVFEDSFDTYTDFAIDNVGNWTLTDVDGFNTYGISAGSGNSVVFANSGVAKSFQVFNSTTTNPALTPGTVSDWTARTGNKSMVCFASNPSNGGGYNNDWLISPQISLGNTNTLSFWYKACHTTYGAEKFSVGISTTGTAPADFTIVSANPITLTTGITYVEYTYSFPASFDGQDVYVGIHCTSQDQFGFMVDDFKIEAQTLSANDVNAGLNKTFTYPNPAKDVLNVKLGDNFNASTTTISLYSILGKKVATYNYATSLNINQLPKGVYMVKIADNNNSITSKLVIE